jgi:methyl-accepting chemotaxis protein
MGAVVIVPDPARIITAFTLSPSSLALAIAGIAVAILGMSLVSAFADRRISEKRLLLATALNNMTQGVVMFDDSERLVICNARYLEMYDLPRNIIKPGCKLIDVLQHRFATGSLATEPAQYRAELLEQMRNGNTVNAVIEMPNGRAISVANKPIEDGLYWIGTHDDITERRSAEERRALQAEQEHRRTIVDDAIGAFRSSIEGVLKTVSDSTAIMHKTASDLSSTSSDASSRTAEISAAAGTASAEIGVAARAADEMAMSISEIDRQLQQATKTVADAVAEATDTNSEIQALAQTAQKIGDVVQTAKATEDIAAQIKAVQNSTGRAVEAIHRISSRMKDINDHTTSIAASVWQQNAATGEISKSVTSAVRGAKGVDALLGQVTQAVTKASTSAVTALTASQAVEGAASQLRLKVEEFLDRVAV